MQAQEAGTVVKEPMQVYAHVTLVDGQAFLTVYRSKLIKYRHRVMGSIRERLKGECYVWISSDIRDDAAMFWGQAVDDVFELTCGTGCPHHGSGVGVDG